MDRESPLTSYDLSLLIERRDDLDPCRWERAETTEEHNRPRPSRIGASTRLVPRVIPPFSPPESLVTTIRRRECAPAVKVEDCREHLVSDAEHQRGEQIPDGAFPATFWPSAVSSGMHFGHNSEPRLCTHTEIPSYWQVRWAQASK